MAGFYLILYTEGLHVALKWLPALTIKGRTLKDSDSHAVSQNFNRKTDLKSAVQGR